MAFDQQLNIYYTNTNSNRNQNFQNMSVLIEILIIVTSFFLITVIKMFIGMKKEVFMNQTISFLVPIWWDWGGGGLLNVLSTKLHTK